MRTTVVQSVEISTLKTSADLPIQIRIRRSTSGQAVRLRNAIASPSQTSAVDRRCWRASAKYETRAPIVICHHEDMDRAIPAFGRTRRTNGFADNRACHSKVPSRDKVSPCLDGGCFEPIRSRNRVTTKTQPIVLLGELIQVRPRNSAFFNPTVEKQHD